MTELLDYLLEDETAVVFDIDGVLCVYEFGRLSHSACDDDEWESYVKEHDPYGSARPVALLQRFIERKGRGRVYACSVAEPYESKGKLDFVIREYGIPEDHVAIVSNKADKVEFMRNIASELNIEEPRVALVEDTVGTLFMLNEISDFTTVHISSFFAYEE